MDQIYPMMYRTLAFLPYHSVTRCGKKILQEFGASWKKISTSDEQDFELFFSTRSSE